MENPDSGRNDELNCSRVTEQPRETMRRKTAVMKIPYQI
jgi:hypothetical protein